MWPGWNGKMGLAGGDTGEAGCREGLGREAESDVTSQQE